ncbi:bifunctional diaminohydroxyphosphoribosylaminopyrimidine deaminase/5-amino-6-(5-phosphoribosylamino)uracil reductase RibD [uncultured Brevundimonas sp.]|uniref:bifunctional diaminohydroxyphosphoribosylaminopyrimidine deaminase/5-amino-6-(5-phosphoribosylamino)uracil reductase RibD n=1 Tax=uncultured Brevundimonas sp. TaxID=213418 RepID=UPI0026284A4A|nr:bifunctional diaminohydroxyphosphoribosylaminopyrimidine deaminase/5-amino-6-(5-phosphoribosylamino)uracil reductase RibD [uncultured Brevundimonas sp.]
MRPRVTLKVATSLDGRIAMASGESQWITGPEARQQGHRLRARHDAILVGVETVLADDPSLNVRIEGEQHKDPQRIVLDSRLRTPPTARLLDGAWIITTSEPREIGNAEVITVAGDAEGRPDPEAVLDMLAAREIGSVLIEGGGRVAASFVKAGLVDAIEWFRAPMVLGHEGRPAIAALGFDRLSDTPRFKRLAVSPLGDDLWERYEKA